MDAMDVDEGVSSRRLSLIRAVRTVDEDDSTLPDKIHRLWLLLSAVKGTRLHGVEESILRWLFKQMSGKNENAEQARRYPLTWAILGHIFPKIPAQTLGRSLAYLRFVSVLNKTLEDVSTAQRIPGASQGQTNGVGTSDQVTELAKKRKRDDALPSGIDSLRTPEGCLKSAAEIFHALGSLLGLVTFQSEALTPETRVGAEHIKSLFSSANEESRDITAKLLLICDRSLSFVERGIVRDQEPWMDILTTIWNLRLHSKEDSADVAKHLYEPTCSILARLKGIAGFTPVKAGNSMRNLWVRQLEHFLSTYFIRPARHRFAVDENVEMLKMALTLAKRNAIASITVMWDVAARTPRDLSDPKSKTEHATWAQSVFEVLLGALESIDPTGRNAVIVRLLDTARQTGSVPNTSTLRDVCKAYALASAEIDWTLISKITACDADVFLTDNALMIDIFDRVSSASLQDSTTRDTVVTEVILPLQDAFVNARDLAGFVTPWYDCLCQYGNLGDGNSLDQSIWLDPRIRQRLASHLESAFSSTQLLRLLDRLDTPNTNHGALLVILDGVCAGITQEEFMAKVDAKIFSATFSGKTYDNLPSEVMALRWRVAGYMASWETSDECYRLWAETRPTLKGILRNNPLTDAETFEAFICCYKLCLANHIGGRDEAELNKLTSSFLERLISTVKVEADPLAFRQYLGFVFRHLPKLVELPKQEVSSLADLIIRLFWQIGQRLAAEDGTQLREVLQPLLHNFDVEDEEPFLDALISQPLDALDSTEAQCGWTQPHSFSVLLILLEFPLEAFTKGRRKRIMSSWRTWRSAIFAHASQNAHYATAVLRLLVKVMQQPTFYEGMTFDDLAHITSETLSSHQALLPFVERLIDLTLAQMTVNIDDSSLAYLQDASSYVLGLNTRTASNNAAPVLLTKGLVSALNGSSSAKANSGLIDTQDITRKLEQLVEHSFSAISRRSKDLAASVGDGPGLIPLSVALSGASCVTDARPGVTIKLSDDVILQLESASATYVSHGIDVGWKLRAFLVQNYPSRYDIGSFCSQLEQADGTIGDDPVYDFVYAYVKNRDATERSRILGDLIGAGKLIDEPIGPLLAVRKLLELHPGAKDSSNRNAQEDVDLAGVHEQLSSLLKQTNSLRHFKQLSDILSLLLDKHANSMTQYSVETALSSVTEVCSSKGPKLQGPKAAGEIYDNMYKLVALVIKRHRLRLRGHFPILIATLQSLLYTLLVDPTSVSTSRRSLLAQGCPPWLESRLQPRHAQRFTRLLTLVCEPSAASVARSRSSELDSATDVAKRAAGQDMFMILETYIKLQLEVDVPRDIRKALELGIYSILDITPSGCRRVLNESLDTSGRALFRQMFTDYKKFGKWSGV